MAPGGPVRPPLYRDPRLVAALAEQERLRARLLHRPLPENPRLVGGVDVSFNRSGDTLWGAVVVCDSHSGFAVVDRAEARVDVDFPYVPGLLAFREVPPLQAACARLRTPPEVLICDAHGTAHPRGLGEAAHLGLVLGLPTVGCAKSLLCGVFDAPGAARGERSPLLYEGRTVGAVLRTRSGVAPVFVSPGHRCDLASALELVLRCTPRFRLPEPLRLAHALANEARRAGAV